MASLTIIPYTPKPASSYRSNSRYRAKDAFKRISDHDKELRSKPGVLPVDIPQPQATIAAGEAGSLATSEKDDNSISDGDHLLSKRRGSHSSACTSQAQDQACSQQSQDKGASISMDEAANGVESRDLQIETDLLFAETVDVWDQTYSQQPQDKGAFISKDGSEVVGGVGDCDVEVEIDFLFDEIGDIAGPQNDGLLSEVNSIFTDTESKADDIESEMRDIEKNSHSLKRKARTGQQGSQHSPLVILDSGTESGSDSESEDELAWKKRKIDHSLVGREVRSWSRRIDESDADGIAALLMDLHSDNFMWSSNGNRNHLCGQESTGDVTFVRTQKQLCDQDNPWSSEIDDMRLRAANAQSKANGIASEIEDGEENEESHPRPATSAAGHSDLTSVTLPERRKSVARSDSDYDPRNPADSNFANTADGEWKVHGIIGKEIFGGEVHYCVDWYPTFVPERELGKAQRLVQEFEAKEQAKHRKMGHTRKEKHRGRPRKQK